MNYDKQKTSELPKMLENSRMWIVLRLDENGIHCHMSDETDLAIIPMFLSEFDELYRFTVEYVNKLKKAKK